MKLSDFSTKELVEELSKREAVEKITAEPYQKYKFVVEDEDFSGSGPVVILKVFD